MRNVELIRSKLAEYCAVIRRSSLRALIIDFPTLAVIARGRGASARGDGVSDGEFWVEVHTAGV